MNATPTTHDTHYTLARLTYRLFSVSVHTDAGERYYTIHGDASDRSMLEKRAFDVGAHVYDLVISDGELTAKFTL